MLYQGLKKKEKGNIFNDIEIRIENNDIFNEKNFNVEIDIDSEDIPNLL